MRSDLMHEYMGVDLDAVWEITQTGVQALKQYVGTIIADLESREDQA